LTIFKREFIIEGMSRLGFKYKKDMLGLGQNTVYVNGKATTKYLRGGFLGCSFIENEMICNDNENEFYDGEHK